MTRGLAIVGHGKMGRLIEKLAAEYGFEVRAVLNSRTNCNGAGLTQEQLSAVDVAVEFSTAASAAQNIQRLAALRIPVVVGTTGWFEELPGASEAIRKTASALLWSSNYSVGLHRFREVVAAAARAFATEAEYESWGWEIHHRSKRDAPSGTLLALADEMKSAGYSRLVSLTATRAGDHPGTHEIGFDSRSDTITIRHTARDREGFARGALRSARWIIGKEGLFEFKDIVHELD